MRNDLSKAPDDGQQKLSAAQNTESATEKGTLPFLQQLEEEDPLDPYYARWVSERYAPQLRTNTRSQIAAAPGFRVRRFLTFFCRKNIAQELIALHDELLTEYFATLHEGDCSKARYQQVRIPCMLVSAVLGNRAGDLLGTILRHVFKLKPGK